MSFQSWSSSFSYSNNGINEVYNYENNHNDNNNIYSTGFRKNRRIKDNEFDEMFYKNIDNSNENKSMMGKSHNNSEWKIRQQINGNLHQNFKQDYNTYSNYFQQFNQPMINNNKLEILPDPIINNTLLVPNNMFSNNLLFNDPFFNLK